MHDKIDAIKRGLLNGKPSFNFLKPLDKSLGDALVDSGKGPENSGQPGFNH